MAYTQLNPRFTPGSRVEQISDDPPHFLLSIPSGKADEYRLAQLDDYAQLARGRFSHRFGQDPSATLRISLSLSARTSSDSIPGTWGFGLWNDPFGLSIGYGSKPFRLPALPNAVWFFGASKENHLSFSDKSANGFLVQSFRSPRFHPLMIPAGLAFPFSRKMTRRLMSRVIAEDGIELSRGDRPVAPTDWHKYSLKWSPNRVSFEVDDAKVFESDVSPNPPLGSVFWIDNQYAAFTPEGKIGFGVLENPEPAWLEIKDLEIG